MKRATRVAPILGVVLLSLTLAVLAGCGGSSGTDGGGGGGSTPPVTDLPHPGAPALSIGETDPLPGVVFTVVGTSGGSGPGGNFRPGDFVTVQFTLKTDLGVTLDLSLMDSGSAYLSGPNFNYNIVIPRKDDLTTASLYLGNATWQYTFPVPLPAVYDAPYNDTISFGAIDGELTGQPLLDGTYTIGLETSKVYTLDGESHRDPGSLVADILVGGATAITTHEEVKDEHCNQCHSDIRFHGDRRVGVRLCVLCHTSGSEDRNNPALSGGTPKTSIDFRVMIHKIHNGKHLPSVLGMTTDASGNRVYAQTTTPLGVTTPYKLVGFSTTDASGFAFPVWPSLNIAMPKDYGYTALNTPATPAGAAKQAAETEFLRGVVSCAKCHGDPDGAGPITAPADGALHETQPSRHACGSCHDDIDWSKPYAANNDVMPANPGTCNVCHPASSTSPGVYAVRQGHTHPVLDPLLNKDLLFDVTAVNEISGSPNGKIDPGEKLSLSFTLTEGDGVTPVLPSTVNSMSVIIAGPTSNYNLVLNSSVLGTHPDVQGAGPYTLIPPEIVLLERVGLDTGALIETFTTTRSRHLNLTGGTGNPQQTKVYVRSAVSAGPVDTGNGSSVSVGAIALMQNYIDVTPGQGVGFVADVAAGAAALVAGSPDAGTTAGNAIYATKWIVIEDGAVGPVPVGTPAFPPPQNSPGAREEYNRIIWRQGDRLWLERPTRMSHAAGVSVKLCTLTQQTVTTHYTLNAGTGQITEVGNAFNGLPVIVTYTTDFMMPSFFPPPFNDSPDLDESWGEWKAKPIVKGTYTVDLYGYKDVVVTKFAVPGPAETQTYRGTSVAGDKDFLVIDDDNLATPGVDPYTVISAAENCYKCHNELFFHGGGRRSFVTCLVCHGDSGAEDKARYANTNVCAGPTGAVVSTAPGKDTTKVTISFRQMLHRIHKGEELANAATYFVIGNSGNQYNYAEVVFPAWPAGVRECKKCHGNDAWHAPKDRTHPTPGVQTLPTRVWRTVCGSCHDSTAAAAHIDVMTSPSGYESCETCHGAGKTDDVVLKHVVR